MNVPFASREPEDITLTLPPYSTHSLTMSRAGNRLAFLAHTLAETTLYTLDAASDQALGALRRLGPWPGSARGPWLAADGGVLVVKVGAGLIAMDAVTGEAVGELAGPIVGDRCGRRMDWIGG